MFGFLWKNRLKRQEEDMHRRSRPADATYPPPLTQWLVLNPPVTYDPIISSGDCGPSEDYSFSTDPTLTSPDSSTTSCDGGSSDVFSGGESGGGGGGGDW